MKKDKARRIFVAGLILIVGYLLQCTVFSKLALASIKPNLLLIITISFGFIRGQREGMLLGFFSGLLIDIQFGEFIGFYALIYLVIGYINGKFQKMYYEDNIKLPLCLIAGSEFAYGIIIYVFMYMLRGRFHFIYYLNHIIIPELIYTVAITLVLYPVILFINQKLELKEKRSASKFV